MKKYHSISCIGAIAGSILGLIAALPADSAILQVPTTGYPTIQAAVDAAHTSDTIQIAPGVYTEQVVISNKVLTLIGQPGTILRATTNLPPFSGKDGVSDVPIMGIRSSQVTVRGLTFEGERLAERFVGPAIMEGIFFRQSSGTVENCAFYGFRESTPRGAANGDGIVFVNFDDGPTEVNLRVTGSTFADNYVGIFVNGLPTRKSVNVTLENNTIVGPGPLNNWSNEGIFIREGVGGRIAGNTISGFSYVGTGADFPISFGILAAHEANLPDFGNLQPLTIEGNTLRDNQMHIALVKADNSMIANNLFQGTAPGIIPLGLDISGTNVTIANNQFEDMPEGIRLLGDDPDFGTILGAAVNAQVMSNRFCNVTKRINIEPLASAKQVGTLLCPFPSPLIIAPAALLSWPNYASGSILESATNVNGVWNSVDATPVIQEGRYTVTVKSDGQQHFYRLRAP